MKQVPSADFRKTYTRETEAIEVTSYDLPIALWLPAQHPAYEDVLKVIEGNTEQPATPTPEPRMTIRPVKGTPQRMVATEKRVIDPVDIREKVKAQEHARFRDPQLGRRLPRPG